MTDSAEKLMAKAGQAVASAYLLLQAGDQDGACNRAYYAMFDAFLENSEITASPS